MSPYYAERALSTRFDETIQPESQMQSYLSLYKTAIAEVFTKALRDTCYRRLAGKGMVANGVCEEAS